MMTPLLHRLILIVLFQAAIVPSTAGGAEIVLDSPMFSDPAFETPEPVKTLSPGLRDLWYQVLESPETELTMRAAEAIARTHSGQYADLSDAGSPLRSVLSKSEMPLAVRLAVIRALIAIDARDAADDLYRQAQRNEREIRHVVEPALAAWNYKPIRDAWLARLTDDRTPDELLRLAIRCLAVVREPAASERLQSLAGSRATSPPVRLEAARALGQIESAGQESFARSQLSDRSNDGLVDRLVAATVLMNHRSEQTTAILKELALDDEPAVAVIALQTLLETDPKLVLPFAGQLLTNADAKVRRLSAQSLVEVPSPAAVASLGPLLDDPHPDVRRYVRDSLFTLAAKPELDEPVRKAGMDALGGDSWREQEQASLLLGALDHEPAADRMLELLLHERPEVMVAAAWGLRKLALPGTLSPILKIAERKTEQLKSGTALKGTDEQLAQAFQMFGQMTFDEADSLLRQFVPKDRSFGEPSRMAAIWTLGHLHAGQPDERLVSQLQARLRDIDSMDPETDPIRGMAAITLGRMRAEAALPALREFDAPNGAIGYPSAACNWSITLLTGETFPKAKPVTVSESGWFLEPLSNGTGDGGE